MKQMLRKWLSAALAVCMLFSVSVTTAFAEDEGNALPSGGGSTYTVTVSSSSTTVEAGSTVTLTATVTKNGNTEVTDLESEGIYLWWWTDTEASRSHDGGNSDATYNYSNGNGYSLTADVTVPSTGTYYIVAELQDKRNEDLCSWATIEITVKEASTSTPTATLDKYTTTESGSFTITFSQSLTSSVYYKIQVISTAVGDGNWDSYGDGYAVNTTTQESSYEISGLSAGTYYIYVGYSGDWSTLIPGSTVLTVNADGVDDITGCYLGITLDSEKDTNSANAGNDDYNPIYVYGSTDTVNVTVTLYNGDGEEPDSFPSGYQIYVWFEDKYETDDDYENPLVEKSTNVTTTGQIALSGGSYTFETGTTYNVYARIEYTDHTEIDGTMVSTSFTINTKYGITGYINSSSTDGQVFNLGDTITVSPTYTTYVNDIATTEDSETIPTGTMMTIYYEDDTGTWYDPVYSYGTRVRADENGVSTSQSGTITLSAGNFTPGKTYIIYYELYNEGGETLAVTSLKLEINKPKFYTRTLTLDGGIGLNYYVIDNGVGTTGTGSLAEYYVKFTVTDCDTGIDTVSTVAFDANKYRDDWYEEDNVYYYRFTGYVDSTQIGDKVYVELIYTGGTGDKDSETDDDKTIRKNTYSVATYCNKAIENSGWAEKELCNALLTYGKYARAYFNETNEPYTASTTQMTDLVSEGSISATDLESYKAVNGDSNTSAISLGLYSLTNLTLTTSSTFNTTAAVAGSKTTSATVYTDDDSNPYVRVPAYLLNNTYTFTTSGGTVECSALSYVYEVLNATTGSYLGTTEVTTNLQNVCKAIYYLAEEADNYTNSDGWYKGTH